VLVLWRSATVRAVAILLVAEMAFLVAAQIYMIGHESRLRMNALAAVVGLVIIGAACISRVAQTFFPSETEMALANSEGERSTSYCDQVQDAERST
jgi:hypothetical protein